MGTRPYAQVGIHDPDGQAVHINQKNMKGSFSEATIKGLYLEGDYEQPRHVEYLALRTPNPECCPDFYRDVFEMTPLNRHEGDDGYSFTDERDPLKLIPWKIRVYDGMDVSRPMLYHFGIEVEDIEDSFAMAATIRWCRLLQLDLNR